MKNIFTILFALLMVQVSYAQINITAADQTLACGSTLTLADSGGTTGDYGNNEAEEITICPDDATQVVQIQFTSVGIETCCDDLGVYNGTGTATIIDDDVEGAGTYTSSAAGDCLTVSFASDGSIVDTGFEATLSCTTPPVNPCTAAGAPSDDCSTATLLDLSSPFAGSTDCGYTGVDEGGSCGSVENNSWFRFVAGAADVEIDWAITGGSDCAHVAGSSGIQLGVMEGTCGSLTNVGSNCVNPTGGIGQSGTFNMTGLTPGNTYYLQIDGFAGDLCEYTITPVSGVVVSCSAALDATNTNDISNCFGSAPTATDAMAGFTVNSFDAGAGAQADAGVAFAEICGLYDASANTTASNPTTNPNYTGFMIGTAYPYNPGTATGTDGEGTACDYITLVPLTYVGIDAGSGNFLLDGNDCIATGTPIIVTFRPQITATYDCATQTLSVAGGAQDDEAANAVAGDYTVTGDITGTTTGGQITSAGITTDGTYNINVTDSAGCTEAITLTVTGCPVGCAASSTMTWN